ncbi:MAG: hypothetical protein EPO02_12835 [Nitrospirae bacterium]|nr:MAG: hypothetical protein EPO02_12835 [Nitrospirota bacterium]
MTDNLNTDLQEPIPEEPIVGDEAAADTERLYRATVSKIVVREREKAYNKAKQELRMEQEQQMQQQAPQAAPQVQSPQGSFGGMPVPQTAEDIQRMIAEHVPQYLQHQANEYQHKQFADGFVSKMQAAEQQYPGLEAKLEELNWEAPGTLALAKMVNNLDNSGDIMNELMENPEKMGSLLTLIHEQPKLAQNKLASLSKSIKTNQEALASEKSANQPIGQLKSSVNAGVDDHNLTVEDLRKMFPR